MDIDEVARSLGYMNAAQALATGVPMSRLQGGTPGKTTVQEVPAQAKMSPAGFPTSRPAGPTSRPTSRPSIQPPPQAHTVPQSSPQAYGPQQTGSQVQRPQGGLQPQAQGFGQSSPYMAALGMLGQSLGRNA